MQNQGDDVSFRMAGEEQGMANDPAPISQESPEPGSIVFNGVHFKLTKQEKEEIWRRDKWLQNLASTLWSIKRRPFPKREEVEAQRKIVEAEFQKFLDLKGHMEWKQKAIDKLEAEIVARKHQSQEEFLTRRMVGIQAKVAGVSRAPQGVISSLTPKLRKLLDFQEVTEISQPVPSILTSKDSISELLGTDPSAPSSEPKT